VDLSRPRTITLGWAITPSKPLRKDWRDVALNQGLTYTTASYTMVRPNYPEPMPGETAESIAQSQNALRESQNARIVMWYGFGPFVWVGAPEYAKWYREWEVSSYPPVPPDPNSNRWGWACHRSSGSDLFLSKLERFVKEYPQKAIYVDCYFMMECANEAHGCGYVDEHGVRRMISPLLATRRHYERLRNIIMAADPQYGWVRIHDWGLIMPVAAFADDNWSGENLITPIGNTEEKNYYRVFDLAYARLEYRSEQWGHMQAWLTELGVWAARDPDRRELWYGKMVEPPKDGKRGKWIVPRMADYEHVAGLALIHDMWMFGGNDAGISREIVRKMKRRLSWDDSIQFTGYWDLGETLEMDGAVPEKVVCSVYFKPAGTGADGKATKPWLMLVPMNNTDQDVTVTLRPNLSKFGLTHLADGQLRDAYRATDFIYEGGKKLNERDVEVPYVVFESQRQVYVLDGGSATLKLPKWNFKALLLEPRD